jgi:septal ring factor EnvC (AmiA/AmiB activator)
MSAALLLAVSLLAASPAGDLEDEHAQLQDRLEAEKTLFESLGSEKKNLLTLLDTLERLARESADRSAKLERTLKKVTRQVADASAEAEADQRALAEQQAQLRPRLASLYRLHRQDTLGTLLSSTDFSTLIKRQRALKTLVASELAALDDLALLERRATFQEHRLERLQTTAQRYVRALRSEQAVGQARLGRFKELLASVNAEQNRRSRVITELEASEKELAGMVAEMQSSGAAGFRARKGQLPFPTHGIVEVGFGKVVNPRFNTVTVQKGIDVRAPEGREVASVGRGAVAFSGWLKGYGNLVIIDHGGGYHSLYAHLSSAQVDVGAAVEEGEILGLVGDTGSLKGPYLYFEIRKGGQAIDPQPWLKQDE